MNTYLIFFGKSQSFTFTAYTENGAVPNFDTVIRDFELLESKYFTVDQADNLPILAKYYFKYAGKRFSLLKLYSHGQAAGGDRVEGSIYGVALLSEKNISLSKTNIDILKECKKVFAEQSLLNGIKFKSAVFDKETTQIWQAFNKENGFSRVEYSDSFPDPVLTNPAGFYVRSLDDAPQLDQWDDNTQLYFSEDLEHLKRAAKRSGGTFAFYLKQDDSYELYEEPGRQRSRHASATPNPGGQEILGLQDTVIRQKEEISRLEAENTVIKEKAGKFRLRSLALLVSLLVIILGIALLIWVFKIPLFTGSNVIKEQPPLKAAYHYSLPDSGNLMIIKTMLRIDKMSSEITGLQGTLDKANADLSHTRIQLDSTRLELYNTKKLLEGMIRTKTDPAR